MNSEVPRLVHVPYYKKYFILIDFEAQSCVQRKQGTLILKLMRYCLFLIVTQIIYLRV